MQWLNPQVDTSDLEARLSRLAAPEPGADLPARLRSLAEVRPEPATPPRVRRRAGAWALALTLGCACLVVALFTWRTGPAFAQVENAFGDLQTVNWRETQTHLSLDGGPDSLSYDADMWVRLDPPAISRRNENGFRSLIDRRGQLVHVADTDRYTLSPEIGKLVSSRFVFSHVSLLSQYPGGIPSGWASRKEKLNGRELLRFDREQFSPGQLPNFGRDNRVRHTATIWTDPETLRLVRSERRQHYPGSDAVQYLTIGEGYRYNAKPAAGTWDWSAPAGRQAELEHQTPMRHIWSSLPDKERKQLQSVVDRSDRGWLEGDMDAFASVWDFDGMRGFKNHNRSGAEHRRG